MNHYEEFYKQLKKKYTDEEIAEGFMIPDTLTEEEQAFSDQAFRQMRFELLNNRTEQEHLISEVTRLRISIKKYLEEDIYSPLFSFGQVLGKYIALLKVSKKQFSEDVAIHYTKLSRILNEKEEPNIGFIYRLECHSDELIPAVDWWHLTIRKQEHLIKIDDERKRIERLKVKNNLKATA